MTMTSRMTAPVRRAGYAICWCRPAPRSSCLARRRCNLIHKMLNTGLSYGEPPAGKPATRDRSRLIPNLTTPQGPGYLTVGILSFRVAVS